MNKKGFIFDLDGVIVDTAKYHFLAWQRLAKGLDINFTEEENEQLKGVSRVRSLEKISQVHHKVEQDNLLENMHTMLRFRIRDVNIFASILVTLGLVGTIVGLIIMMEDLTLAIQNIKQDSGGLLQSLLGAEGPLAGLGLAFYTTLLGSLCGGIILRILASVMDSQITKYVAYVLEMTEIYILPALRKNAENSSKEGSNET